MTPRERFQLAAALYLEVSELPASEVEALLACRCADDAALRRQVLELMGSRGHEREVDSLAEGLSTVHEQLREQVNRGQGQGRGQGLGLGLGLGVGRPRAFASVEAVGRRDSGREEEISGFRCLELLGEGALGSVWAAEQRQPVERRVALKVISVGVAASDVLGRFEQEREALASLDHPNIAKVFGAGATSDGRAYFVMELCKGEPISAYCDAYRLTIVQRLELFVQLCGAVQHAHSKGVIHRDIQPSNVLASTQDGRAFVRVTDFGVARALGARFAETRVCAKHGRRGVTPAYVSPEQAEGLPDLDSRTDVYSLGVILHELVTGTTPGSDREPDCAMERAARVRRREPRRPGAEIVGELDWIVSKSLEQDRWRRYESAASLAEDVRRYLAGSAVAAAPPSRMYRARKFARGHRRLFVAGAAVVLLVAGGLVWRTIVASTQGDEPMAAGPAGGPAR